MKELVEYVAKALVDNPEEVVLDYHERNGTIFTKLRLVEADIAKIIGKSGNTICAIRTIMSSVAAAKGKRIIIEVLC